MSINQGADRAPSPQMIHLPPWPAVLVHCLGGRPVYVDPHSYGLDEPMDARCPGCRRAEPEVRFSTSRPEAGGIVAILVHHQPGCRAVRDLAEMARRPR